MKLTPLLIFLIILFVLVIFTVVWNYFNENGTEGFVSFYATRPQATVTIQGYSNPVQKMYDTIFFDQINANIIEIDSSRYNGNIITGVVGNVDLTGSTITTAKIILPNGDYNMYSPNTVDSSYKVPQSLISSVPSLYRSWYYPTRSLNTDKYTVFYMPWDRDTYIQMIDNDTRKNVGVWHSSPRQTTIDRYMYTAPNDSINLNNFYDDTTNPLNGTMVNETYYDSTKPLYQISKYVKFDIKSGYLVIQTATGSNKSITYYDRNFTPYGPYTNPGQVTNTPNIVSSVSGFAPHCIVDQLGQNLITYIAMGTKTFISLISYNDSHLSSYALVNVCRFDSAGLVEDSGSNNDDITPLGTGRDTGRGTGRGTSAGSSSDDDRYDAGIFDPNRYLLKTQIVPPVCPACPACPKDGLMCTNCGGNGGSGTLSKDGSIAGGNNPASAALDATGDVIGGVATGAGLAVGGVAAGAGQLVGGAEKAVGGAAEGAGRVVGGAVSGVGSAVGGVASGIGSAVGGVASGIGSAIGGVHPTEVADDKQMDKSRGTQLLNYGNIPLALGTQNQYSDQYSYNGQLPAKTPSSFMPVTADFSAFSK